MFVQRLASLSLSEAAPLAPATETTVAAFPPPISCFWGGGGDTSFSSYFLLVYTDVRGGVSFRKKSIIMFSFFLFQRSILFTVRFLCFLATRKAQDL